MKIIIEIECENSAFDENAGSEVARILKNTAAKFLKYEYSIQEMDDVTLYDINGNNVGSVEVKE